MAKTKVVAVRLSEASYGILVAAQEDQGLTKTCAIEQALRQWAKGVWPDGVPAPLPKPKVKRKPD